MPPFIINCPEFFQKRPDNSQEPEEPAAPMGVNFTIQMASFFSYKKDRELFFQQLMEILEILDRSLKEAQTRSQKELVKRRKRNFEALTALIMEKLLGR